MRAEAIFLEALDWLKEHYQNYIFYVERDIVWTLQTKINILIKEYNSPFIIHNDYTILPRQRADLVFLHESGQIELAIEFKYEPSHKRIDIVPTKFPVASWSEIGKDIERIKRFVTDANVTVSYSVFFDEERFYRNKPAHHSSKWNDWENSDVSVLLARKEGSTK